MEMKITGWSLKFYECLLCLERHSRNRRWLAEFSSEKEEVELVDLPRTAQVDGVEFGLLDKVREGKPCWERESPVLSPSQKSCLAKADSDSQVSYTWEAQADFEATYSI